MKHLQPDSPLNPELLCTLSDKACEKLGIYGNDHEVWKKLKICFGIASVRDFGLSQDSQNSAAALAWRN